MSRPFATPFLFPLTHRPLWFVCFAPAVGCCWGKIERMLCWLVTSVMLSSCFLNLSSAGGPAWKGKGVRWVESWHFCVCVRMVEESSSLGWRVGFCVLVHAALKGSCGACARDWKGHYFLKTVVVYRTLLGWKEKEIHSGERWLNQNVTCVRSHRQQNWKSLSS